MKRLFIGIPIVSDTAVGQVEIWKKDAELNRNVLKYTRPDNWHITLFFLGNTDESLIPVLEQMIALSFAENIMHYTNLKGIGVFPNLHNPKVLWIGIENVDSLLAAHARLESLLLESGLGFDQKPLKPHLTIARVKRVGQPDSFDRLQHKNRFLTFGTVLLEKIVLYESVSTPDGPVYVPLFVKNLKAK